MLTKQKVIEWQDYDLKTTKNAATVKLYIPRFLYFCISVSIYEIFSTLKHLLLKGLLLSIAHFHKKMPRLVHKQDIYVLLLLMIVDESGGQQVS